MNRDDELITFKTIINLSEYAARTGYDLDQKKSSRNSAVMVHPNGDKIIIARDTDDHWIYFSVRDSTDHGTIIDFVQRRENVNLGGVRKILRNYAPISGIAENRYSPSLEPISRDTGAARAAYEATRPLPFGQHSYLNERRKLPPSVLSRPRLEGRIHVDDRENAVFVHFNAGGVCGFELKNNGFTGFSKHGTKGLWCSRGQGDDDRMAIAESPIDALSYAVLHDSPTLRLFSTGGTMNPAQPAMIVSAIQKLPAGEVIIAVDNDPGGDEMVASLRECFNQAGRDDLTLIEDRPPLRGQDWNQVLCDDGFTPAPIL